jgi:hypothetical protein
MGFFTNKPDKSAKMRAVKVSLGPDAKAARKSGGKTAKTVKPMSFTEWVEHYAKMSKGNPV